jgi:flagellar biosynthesis GTPase FlhF
VAEADSGGIKDRMINLEKQFNKIPQAQSVKPDESLDPVDTRKHQNFRLYSPSLLSLIGKKDASEILKDQIGESALRLKAAKFGQTVDEIAPQY